MRTLHLTLSQRIVFGVTLMLLFGSVISTFFFFDLTKLNNTLEQVIGVEEPVSAAAYEMEINALGTGLAVMQYMDNRDPALRARAMEDMAEFEQFYTRYDKLVIDDEAKKLGREAHQKFGEFRKLGIAMMDNRDTQEGVFTGIAANFLQMEALVDLKLLARVKPDQPRAFEKMHLLRGMDTNMAEINVWLAHYLRLHDPMYKERLAGDTAQLLSEMAQFKRIGLQPEETGALREFEKLLEQTLKLIAKKIELHEEARRQEAHFIELRTQIDDLLDEGVQQIAVRRLTAAKVGADAAVNESLGLISLATLLVALVSFGAAALMIRMIKTPLRELSKAADIIGQGNLAHRVPENGNDELATLARQFNQMVSRLEATTVSKVHLELSEDKLRASNFSLNKEIDERKEAQEAIRQMAYFDPLTDLPNRRLFYDRLHQAVLQAERDGKHIAVLLMDLDRFKEVNDTLGHHQGDVLLKQVGERIGAVLRESDTVARLGGDEFAVMMPGADLQGGLLAANKIIAQLALPFSLGEVNFEIGTSIGIALFPEHGQDPESLLRCADIAMYVAKNNGGGQMLYGPELDHHSTERLTLLGDLRGAIDNNALMLYYQPLVSTQNVGLRGVEALVRWQHPTRGLLMPDQFIPLAETAGAVTRLTWWVIEEAVRQCALWREQGHDIPVAVNLSSASLHQKHMPEQINEVLTRYSLPPQSLRLEITESAIMTDPANAMGILARLSDMGIPLIIDDFGTGYSSLAYLSRLPVCSIKIDKSFVIGMLHNEDDEMIVRSTIDLAHNLRLSVTAEGVEHAEIFEKLTAYECDVAQGYHISRPLAAEALIGWVETSAWSGNLKQKAF